MGAAWIFYRVWGLRAIEDVLAYIEAQKAERPHLGEFLEAWRDSCDGQFHLG